MLLAVHVTMNEDLVVYFIQDHIIMKYTIDTDDTIAYRNLYGTVSERDFKLIESMNDPNVIYNDEFNQPVLVYLDDTVIVTIPLNKNKLYN